MFKYIVLGLLISSVIALKESDKCPNENEKPGLLEKSCDDKKYQVYKELTCVCSWFYYRNADGDCVKSDVCEGKTTTTTSTTTAAPSTPCPTQKPQPNKCPDGYELYVVSCKRHYGYGGYDYYGKKCAVCKQKKPGK